GVGPNGGPLHRPLNGPPETVPPQGRRRAQARHVRTVAGIGPWRPLLASAIYSYGRFVRGSDSFGACDGLHPLPSSMNNPSREFLICSPWGWNRTRQTCPETCPRRSGPDPEPDNASSF